MFLKSKFKLALSIAIVLNAAACKKDNNDNKTEPETCPNGAFNFVRDGRVLAVPTAITPNGDRANDEFWPITNMSPDSFSVQVSDGSGKLLYTYSAAENRWESPGKASDYQYYVTIKVTAPDGEQISSCAPLFVLQTEEGQCIHNAKAEDRARYNFADEYNEEDHLFNILNRECYLEE